MSLRQIATQGFYRSGLAGLTRRLLARSFVVTFHGVAARRYPGLPIAVQPSFAAAELRAALRWIGSHFRFLTPRQLLEGERTGVLLTFDDGFANNVANALPILEELEAPAVFFVTLQHVEEPRNWLAYIRQSVEQHLHDVEIAEDVAHDLFDGMSRRQLTICAEHPLITLGSHTVSHPLLTASDDSTLAAELADSKHALGSWSGQPVDLLAYPSGDYDRRVAEAARAAGYRAAFAEDTRTVGLPAWEIPRIGLYDYRAPYLAAKLSGLHRRGLRRRRLLEDTHDR